VVRLRNPAAIPKSRRITIDVQKTAAPRSQTTVTLAGVIGAMGIVFGDIATSPLYTLQECLTGPHGVRPEPANVLGCVSLIVWSLLLVVTIKYVAVLMQADNRGEGGILALLALVPQRQREPAPGVLSATTVLVLIGAALLFGDGIITPAISVLSAVEGLRVTAPGLERAIVPVTVIILAALFSVQSRGSGGLGRYFGPIMALWLGTAFVLGVVHIVARPQALTALSPHHAIEFLIREKFAAFRALGGVVLSVTGGEALYADMGHFGRRPIRVAWLTFALPALVTNYVGQGALLIGNSDAAHQPFYALVPSGPAGLPFVLLGTAATVIASQALISGVFSLVYQGIRLGYFPRITVRHTSKETMGQIYVPFMNVFVAASAIALVLLFRESGRLAAAFGLAVSGTMAVTSLAFYRVARIRFGWPPLLALAVVGGFLVIDLAFLGANLLKFVDGGYVPAIVAIAFGVMMIVWARGRGLLRAHYEAQSETTSTFLASLPTRIDGRIPGVGVVMTATAERIPPVLLNIVRRFRTLHRTVLLTTVTTEEVPHVAERVEVEPIGSGLYRVLLRYGFMDEPQVHGALIRAMDRIEPAVEPAALTYVLGQERVVPGPAGRLGPVSERIYAVLARNTSNPSDFFDLPLAQVIEVGARVDL
jgi:KUP system potassium uptake protein